MTTSTSKYRKAANPKTILEQIGSQHWVRDGELESPVTSPESPDESVTDQAEVKATAQSTSDTPNRIENSNSAAVANDRPRLRIVRHDQDDENAFFEDGLEEVEQPSRQLVEIANHLRTRSQKLERGESELKKQINIWQNQVDSQLAISAYRERELRQREGQVRSLQFDLLQLQNDIIDSQLAMEEIVEQFATEQADGQLVLALEMLRFEIRERFDYVSQRWDKLHLKLEQLSNRRRKKCA